MIKQDKSREWFTLRKWFHMLKVLWSKKATKILDAYEKFIDIDFEWLKNIWKKRIILDVDDAIAPHHSDILPENFKKIKEVLELWFKIIVFSNMKKTKRYDELEKLWIEIHTSKFAKPNKRWFLECLEKLETSPDETIMIWDNYLTDGWSIYAWIDFIKLKAIKNIWKKTLSRRTQIIMRDTADKVAMIRGNLRYKKSPN